MLNQAARLVAAYVRTNRVRAAELPDLIRATYSSLVAIGQADVAPMQTKEPAVPVKRSVTPDYIVCLEDGKKLKMLKRHLQTAYGMTPDEYRAKWGLPADYPMVAPNYAEHRSSLAKKIGLGRKPAITRDEQVVAAAPAKAAKPKLSLTPKATTKAEPAVEAEVVPAMEAPSSAPAGQPSHRYPANRWSKPTA
jgi:predicted transcriptional regulator